MTPVRAIFFWLALGGLAPRAHALNLVDYPDLSPFIQEMVTRHGFSEKALTAVFENVQLKNDVVRAIERPREATAWHEYKKTFLDEPHVRDGVRFWKTHQTTLDRAERKFGVPTPIVLGILGIETHYGRGRLDYRVIDALTTLTLNYPPRSDFFKSELEEFLLLSRELKRDPLSVRGSYAGAIGIPQFIPSSYRRYAVDFDGDGVVNLVDSPADAIGSVANFLKRHGWQANQPVFDEAHLEGTLYFWIEKLGVKPALTLQELSAYGIAPRQPADPTRRAALVSFESEDGPFYRLTYDNFYAITRYNRSKRYAMAVTELAAQIKHRFDTPP
jgi:membrane-bound lytic murein transglycosylase B